MSMFAQQTMFSQKETSVMDDAKKRQQLGTCQTPRPCLPLKTPSAPEPG